MIEFLEGLSLLQTALGVTVVSSLGLVWRYVLKPSIAFGRRVSVALAGIERIQAMLGPNGGKSLYDRVDAAGRSAQLSQARLSTMIDVVVERAMFETDERGDFTWVNEAFERTFETSVDEMAGRGWINLIVPADRDRFVRDWRHAVGDNRPMNTMAQYLTLRRGLPITGKVCARPILDDLSGKAIAWMGTIDPVAVSDPLQMGPVR
jgi:PAS domain S-box-containing protein